MPHLRMVCRSALSFLLLPLLTAAQPFVFRDVGDEVGAFPHVAGIRGHAAAWGDADGDGWPDLFIGTFHESGSKPSMFLRNKRGKFHLDEQKQLRTSGSGSGALFVDLMNNGRLDLYVSNCAHGKEGSRTAASALFRNDGDGKFSDVSKDSGACPSNYAGRGVAALDFDGDGLLDLLTCECYYGSVKTGPAVYRNKGHYRFENVASSAGLPAKLAGLGAAVADVNNDGWPDIFLSASDGNHRLYLNDGKGGFREAKNCRSVFRWKLDRAEDTPAGVCIADVNRDGLPDIVIGQHFKTPWKKPIANRLYLHRGVRDGEPRFEDVTDKAGIAPLAMKAPHVEIQDFDNDGWPDIYTSVVKFRDGKAYPLIYRNLGVRDGVPRFEESAWAVNDYPTGEDVAVKRTGDFFHKMLADGKIMYMAAAPSCDYDRDGRLDLFMANWWIESRSLLLRNETKGGNWLDVSVRGDRRVNRMGIGCKIEVYPAGKLDRRAALLGCREINIGYGYCSGQEATAHFGLGTTKIVDVRIVLPHGKGTLTRKNVKANQRLTVAAAGKPARKAAGKPARKPVKKNPAIVFPPRLPDGQQVVSAASSEFLTPPDNLKEGVAVAKTPPTVDFLFLPGQTYETKLWSTWGDGLAVDNKFYASFGDHDAPFGNAFVYEYDADKKKFRRLVDVKEILHLPDGHYTPGKIHSRIDRGADGYLYFSTHRGSPKATTDAVHYKGDWILRVDPKKGGGEIVAAAPVPKHSIPCSVLDPKRLIFYGGTAPASDKTSEGIRFFAYDIKNRKILYSGPDGPARYLIFSSSTGRVYFTPGTEDPAPLMRYDPDRGGAPVKTSAVLGLRAATQETSQGLIYSVSTGQKHRDPAIWSFNPKTEEVRRLGTAAVGTQGYVASLDADSSGRYLYYVPGAHGGSSKDGSPVVQFDVKTNRKKIIAFLYSYYQKKYGCALKGTYSTAVSPNGDKLYIVWNVSRGSRAWDCVALTVIHIPQAERQP